MYGTSVDIASYVQPNISWLRSSFRPMSIPDDVLDKLQNDGIRYIRFQWLITQISLATH